MRMEVWASVVVVIEVHAVLYYAAIRRALRTGSTATWILATVALGIILRNAAEQSKVTQFVAGANVGGDIGFLRSPWASRAVVRAMPSQTPG